MSGERESEEDVDIYGDIPNFLSLENTVKELEEAKKVLEDEVKRLKEKLKEVTTEKNELDSKFKSLSLNISVLYKTASAEIERKDRLIAELRKEKEAILFQRKNRFTKKDYHMPGSRGDHQCYQDAVEQSDYPAPELEQIESDCAEADNRTSHTLTSYVDLPPQNVCSVSSRRYLHITHENNNLTSLDNSYEYTNQESAVSDTELYKDINEKVHHISTHLSKEYDSFSQSESNRGIRKSENISYLSNRRGTLHFETRSERMHMNTKKSDINSFKRTSHTMSKEPVSRHLHKRDVYKSHSRYKVEKCLCSESDRSRTHYIFASSEHQSHSEKWESHRIPRRVCEANVSRAIGSSRSISQSRAVPRSVQKQALRFSQR